MVMPHAAYFFDLFVHQLLVMLSPLCRSVLNLSYCQIVCSDYSKAFYLFCDLAQFAVSDPSLVICV